jgi:hypothetical protein
MDIPLIEDERRAGRYVGLDRAVAYALSDPV